MKKQVKENSQLKCEYFTIEGYKVKEFYYKNEEGKFFNGGRIDRIEVERSGRKYMPKIYVDTNLLKDDGLEITDITIQTTSWGSLPISEIKEVTKGYQKACRVVSKLQEIYKPYIVES